jgi:hypothetical protein
MIKRILKFIIANILVFVVSYFVHDYVVNSNAVALSFSLFSVYLFHVVAAFIVCALVEMVADKLPNQAGYAYLASVFVKMGIFVLVFKDTILSNDQLSKPERFSLIIPLFIFLIIEAVAISNLLKHK